MAATLTWSIDWLQSSTQTIEGYQQVVLQAGWRLIAVDGEVSTFDYGSATFEAPQPNDPNFTPYGDLLPDQILVWVWKSGIDKAEREAAITAKLYALVNPTEIQLPLPWVTND